MARRLHSGGHDARSPIQPPLARRSPWRQLFYRWFIQYNPLYLVSAALVLAEVILLSQGLGSTSAAARSHAGRDEHRHRRQHPVAPALLLPALSMGHLVVSLRLVSGPQSALEWGIARVGTGFGLLVLSLVASVVWRHRSVRALE